ncbi:ThuA domain-containing protein [Agromyces bracchium]|uniref:ThuA domain-containing protein n=1 Tax=Agromyces bracchium TaxID=88376 RepID=A0A6I3MA96_9MICO|nr:ThuA domain-containing protein [Agromyces bracchium]MTH70399.1 ThuA domain-containing protein [Agromyces bracchium]
MTTVLSLFGGWPGHTPSAISAWADELYAELGYEVERSSDIFTLDRDLTGFDLIVIGWNNALTTEDLTDAQEAALLRAVARGSGLAGWHGAGAAFRASLPYRMLLGGDFIEHPAGEAYPQPYDVRIINREHPVTAGVNDFKVASEQYYMHVNPNNTVLAETTFSGEHLPWIEGHTSPVAWVKNWGDGRVFYHSIGHTPADLDSPDVRRLTKQGLEWAKRS